MLFNHTGYDPTIFKGFNYANIPYRTGSNRITVKNWKIYFTQNDVNAFLFAAASAGPTAMMAALDSLSIMMGGPVGGVLAVVLDIVGIASMANLCYLVI